MAAFDPFVYIAFAAGFLAGRLIGWRSVWTSRLALAAIFALLYLLGTLLARIPLLTLLSAIPVSLVFAVVILGLTLVGVRLLSKKAVARTQLPKTRVSSLALPPALLLGLGVGILTGPALSLPSDSLLSDSLYALLFLVAFDLDPSWSSLRHAWVPILSAILGALSAATLVGLWAGFGWKMSFATAFGFGWYSLTGPLVAERVGPTYGLIAFLTNFLRENLTMLASPKIGPRLGAEGVTAIGGATAMDTTLYFVTRFGDPREGTMALASGFVLTVVASIAVPLILFLP